MERQNVITLSTQEQRDRRAKLRELFKNAPLPPEELFANLALFVNRQTYSRYLFIQHIYEQIVDVHGIVAEFGVRWGQNMALFTTLRGIFEPFNYNRRIVGFDTFSGFPSVEPQDGSHPAVAPGGYGVPTGYESYLEALLDYHESESPIAQLRKFELVKGDITQTLDAYLDAHPETVFALAYFDFDLYAPTKLALERVIARMPKGGVLAFDELNHPDFPGETAAVAEVIGISKLRLRRTPYSTLSCYAIVE